MLHSRLVSSLLWVPYVRQASVYATARLSSALACECLRPAVAEGYGLVMLDELYLVSPNQVVAVKLHLASWTTCSKLTPFSSLSWY